MDKYKICQICGHQHPLGHPCLTCNKRGLKGSVIDPEEIGNVVEVLRLHKNDVVVIKTDVKNTDPESLNEFMKEFKKLEIIKKKNIKLMYMDHDDQMVVLRDR